MNKFYSKPISLYFFLGLIFLLSGYTFYILIRGFDPIFGLNFNSPLAPNLINSIPSYIVSSFATLIHVLALAFISYAILAANIRYRLTVIIFWATVNIVFELLQLVASQNLLTALQFPLLSGTFDLVDIFAIIVAATLFLTIASKIDKKYQSNSDKTQQPRQLKIHTSITLPLLTLFGIVSIMASNYVEDIPYDYPSNRDVPIYMSYEELRAPLKIEPNRQLIKAGKVYIFQELLLVNEANKGIHIYDNSIPEAPIHKTFINLPGNLDIAVKNRILYADSFIDLVVINLTDLNNIFLENRITDIFPYQPYQAIPSRQRTFYIWDKSKGVIIGVKPNPNDSRT